MDRKMHTFLNALVDAQHIMTQKKPIKSIQNAISADEFLSLDTKEFSLKSLPLHFCLCITHGRNIFSNIITIYFNSCLYLDLILISSPGISLPLP